MTAGAHARRRLGRGELDARPFAAAACDALFAAVLVDDEIDGDLRLPDAVQRGYAQDELVACFRLCRQLWSEGFDPAALLRMCATLRREGDLGPDDRVRFKHVRAKFKHLRYAHALYGAAHRYPPVLDQVTIMMGQVQDACRTGRRTAVATRTALLRLLLTAPMARWLRAESDRLVPTTPDGFRQLLEADRAVLAALIARPTVTGPVFHAARKVVGRQVSFWDTLRTLAPTEDRYRMSRWLSAINGGMGELHDRLVERRAEAPASYRAAFVLPAEIAGRIAALNRLG